MALPNPLVEIIPLGVDDRIHIFGEYYRPISSDRRGHWVAPVYNFAAKIFVSHYDFGLEASNVDFQHEINWFCPENINDRINERNFSLRNLPVHDQDDVNIKISWIREYYALIRCREISRDNKGYKIAVENIAAKLGSSRKSISWSVNDNSKPKHNRGSQGNKHIAPSASTLKRYVKALEQSEYDLSKLRDGRCNSGNRVKRFGPETLWLLEQCARKYASLKRPTKQGLYNLFERAFQRLCTRFECEGRPLDPKPSYSRFCIEIAKLNRFEVDIARLGRERAGRKWRMQGLGPDVTWALERVEMDFYKVDLQTLLFEQGIWENIPSHLKEKIKTSSTSRWYLCVALDVASRCVLGMRLCQSESKEAAVETLRMVFYDKSHIGRAAGALTPWDQFGPPDSLATDMGGAFVDAYFQARSNSLLLDLFNPPAAQPQLRAFIERFFKTIKQGLLSRFEGNTGGNTQELGDYPAQLRAVLTVEAFADLLVRWCVDVYHNQPHDGLGRETPRDAWLRLTRLKKTRPCPDKRRLRESFGIDVCRRTGRPGVRICGLFYTSEDLQAWCRVHGDASIEVRIDPEDIGEISVRLDPKSTTWIPLACRTRFMRGRRLRDWLLAASDLRRRYGAIADLRHTIVLEAIEAIERTHSRAVSVAEIGDGQSTEKELARCELELGMGFSIPAYDETFEDADSEGTGKPVSTGVPTLPTSIGWAFGRSFATGARSQASAPTAQEATPILGVPDAPRADPTVGPSQRTQGERAPAPSFEPRAAPPRGRARDNDPPLPSRPIASDRPTRRQNPWKNGEVE